MMINTRTTSLDIYRHHHYPHFAKTPFQSFTRHVYANSSLPFNPRLLKVTAFDSNSAKPQEQHTESAQLFQVFTQ